MPYALVVTDTAGDSWIVGPFESVIHADIWATEHADRYTCVTGPLPYRDPDGLTR